MPRIRTIKPEFPQSESMGRVSREARLCFIQLWTLADDSGRLRGTSRMLASLLFPYDDDAPALIDGWIDELEAEGCVQRYVADGNRYLAVSNWAEHQKIDKPSSSKLPAPPPRFVDDSRSLANVRDDSQKPRELSSEDQGSRIKEGIKDLSSSLGDVTDGVSRRGASKARRRPPAASSPAKQADPLLDRFWEAYPLKVGKADAVRAFTKVHADDALVDTMIAAIAAQGLKARCQAGESKFVPHPATWLNGRRWQDEPSPFPKSEDSAVRASFSTSGYEGCI